MVEYHLAKVDVEGSNPFARSIFRKEKVDFALIERQKSVLFCHVKAGNFFDLRKDHPFKSYFDMDTPVWEWLPNIARALKGFDFKGGMKRDRFPDGLHVSGDVYIHPDVKLPPYGVIEGPVYIGARCQLRPGVYIRGNVITGTGCVLGNVCEFKNCLLMDNVQTPHYNYVGDSILGNGSHLGAGVILANLRLDNKPVSVKIGDELIATNLRKFGAVLGDGAQVGCNSVLQPGTLLGKNSMVGPARSYGGCLAEGRREL